MSDSRRWPDFFVVGALKAGTTFLHNVLTKHPDIYMPARKETRYFNYPEGENTGRPPDAICTAQDYCQLFVGASPDQLIGEATPGYLASGTAIERISTTCPEAKIVILLREPVSRLFAEFLMLRDRYQHDLPPFNELVEAGLAHRSRGENDVEDLIAHGEYGKFVPEWRKRMGHDNVGIFIFDDMVSNPEAFTARILQFLGVSPDKMRPEWFSASQNEYVVPRLTTIASIAKRPAIRAALRSLVPGFIWNNFLRKIVYKAVNKPLIDQATADLIADFYRQDVLALEHGLGRSFPTLHFHSGKATHIMNEGS